MEPFGEDLEMIYEIILLSRKIGADKSFWRRCTYDEKLLRYFKKLADLTNNTHRITVDYDKRLSDVLERGNYTYHYDDPAIFQRAGNTGKINKAITIFHFNDPQDIESILKEMNKFNCSPIKIEELLAIGVQMPFLQEEFAVYALGSKAVEERTGREMVPVLYMSNNRRAFGKAYLQKKMPAGCCFPAISNFNWM